MDRVRIVHNKLLGGWFIVRGPHQTPLGGRFDSKAQAQAHLAGQRGKAAVKSAVVRINDAFRDAGREERLVRGRGYYYVQGGEASGFYSSSIYCHSLDATERDFDYARSAINEMFRQAGIDFQIEGGK